MTGGGVSSDGAARLMDLLGLSEDELCRVLESVHDNRCSGVIGPENEQAAKSICRADRRRQRSYVGRIACNALERIGVVRRWVDSGVAAARRDLVQGQRT